MVVCVFAVCSFASLPASLGIQLLMEKHPLLSLQELWKFFFLLCYLAVLHPGPSFVTISAVSPWLSSKYVNFEF